jgi:hypothetical protein
MIKEGYDHFEASKQEPKVSVCERRYVFDAAAPAGSTKPLNFSPSAKCPVYQLDPEIADVVLEKRRSEQAQMAEYIGRNVAVVPSRAGIDGGMNQVFAAKVASGVDAPGYLPRVPNVPPAGPPQVGTPKVAAPVAVAATEPVEAEDTPAAAPQPAQVAKPKPAAAPVFRTASTPSPKHEAKAQSKAVVEAEPQLRLSKQDKNETPPQSDAQMRTAFSASPPATNATLTGAQPVVPAGTFDSRWSGFR